MSDPFLVFVTPAHGRYAVTDICLRQRAKACDQLKERGIRATCVVVADDHNLDIATELGFERVRRDNRYLGRRFNDGYEYAARELLATHVVPLGSDSWIDPAFLAETIPTQDDTTAIYSRHYAKIRKDGLQRQQLWVTYIGGVTMCLPTRMLRKSKYRPCGERLPKGCDGSTIRKVREQPGVEFRTHEVHDLEQVGLCSDKQITRYEDLFARWGVGVASDPWEGLENVYGTEIVRDAQKFYGVS